MRERTTTTRAGRQEGRREGGREEGNARGTRRKRRAQRRATRDPCSSLRSRGYFAWRRLHLFFATIVPLSLPLSLVEFVESLIVRGSQARIVSWNRVISHRLEKERHDKRQSSRNLDTSLSVDIEQISRAVELLHKTFARSIYRLIMISRRADRVLTDCASGRTNVICPLIKSQLNLD